MPKGNNKEFAPKSEETIREEVIKDFALNPDEQKDLVDKITSDRVNSQKKISKAIEQKIHYRNRKEFYKKEAGLKKEPEKKEVKLGEIDPNQFVTKKEFEEKELRNRHSYLTDEEFDHVNALAKGTGKKFEECLNDKIVKEYLESHEALNRIANATGNPSNRFRPSGDTKEKKIAQELNRDLPVGFTPKKN
jgi:hypothetical protein